MFASEKNDNSPAKPKTFKEATQKNSIKEEYTTNLDFFEDGKENEFNSNFFMDGNMLNSFNEKNEEEVQIGSNEYSNLEMFL